MVIIILALIVIIGLTVMLNTGPSSGPESSPVYQFVTFSQDMLVGFFGVIEQWFDFLMVQIQKLSQVI
ncbi:MAG: hypothetical protein NQU46_04250 [Methanolinea sp.]|nr:hypothetical protein [Methanolinea sp.]